MVQNHVSFSLCHFIEKSMVVHMLLCFTIYLHIRRILALCLKEITFRPCSYFSGMNTGVQDAHNLAWKIASVLNGITPLSFLSTYEIERMQVIWS